MKKDIIIVSMILSLGTMTSVYAQNLEKQEKVEQTKNEKLSENKEVRNDDNFDIPDDPVPVSDPLEGFNRPIYSFNKGLDKVILKPVTQTYEKITPNFIQKGVTNALNYLKTPVNVVYFGLQGNGKKAGDAMGRFLLNTFGLGVFDIASEAKIPLEDTTFGETLGVWGVGEGPYVVLPILGGATLRDHSARLAVDMPIAIETNFNVPDRNTITVLKVIDTRKELLPLDKTIEEASLDEYAYVRDATLALKRNSIQRLKEPSIKNEKTISENNNEINEIDESNK